MGVKIAVGREKVSQFCERWKITDLALFGSILREDFSPESDVDLLVTFEPEASAGRSWTWSIWRNN